MSGTPSTPPSHASSKLPSQRPSQMRRPSKDTAMELLDRYLQAVRKYLPLRRQDDIIAELRANMESQIEDRDSEVGRPLAQGEFEDFLRKMGHPMVVATRYQPQQYHVGPPMYPKN